MASAQLDSQVLLPVPTWAVCSWLLPPLGVCVSSVLVPGSSPPVDCLLDACCCRNTSAQRVAQQTAGSCSRSRLLAGIDCCALSIEHLHRKFCVPALVLHPPAVPTVPTLGQTSRRRRCTATKLACAASRSSWIARCRSARSASRPPRCLQKTGACCGELLPAAGDGC